MQENIARMSSHVPIHEVLEEMSKYIKKQGYNIYHSILMWW